MDLKKAKEKYTVQMFGAKNRGIKWNLTFEQWLEWWGDDLDKRGVGKDNLQMQRLLDRGAYELGNIVKGVPAQNSKTYSNMYRKRKSDKAKEAHENYLNVLMYVPSKEPKDYNPDDEYIPHEMFHNGHSRFSLQKD